MTAASFRRRAMVFAIAVAATLLAAPPSPILRPDPANAAVILDGGGSTWSAIAIDQWRADVSRRGLTVNYQASGSTQGRQQYMFGQYDFAVSEIPFQGASRNRDGSAVASELAKPELAEHPYAYMPIVAGGTSFMYQLNVNGKLVRDLKLSGETLTKIFTGVITNWNHPDITKDDGRTFPNLPIRPVVRSDGSGTSAQFSLYMSKRYPQLWNAFCAKNGLPNPCGLTSLYPIFAGATGQPGSDGVTGFTKSSYNNGAITYVEYGYSLAAGLPVVSLLNAAGYFVQPTAANVSIALTRATINPDRTQVLDGVYVNPDPRAYPLSSYSYMIVPTSTNEPFSAEKGKVLGEFINYFLCDGQQKAEPLGYAPLPKNLVETAFEVVRTIPGAPAPPAISACNNPAVNGQFRPDAAPQPKPEDKQGAAGPAVGGPQGPAASGGSVPGQTPTTNADGTSPLANTRDANGVRLDKSGNPIAPIATAVEALPPSDPGLTSILVLVILLAGLFLPPLLIGRAGRTGARDTEATSRRS